MTTAPPATTAAAAAPSDEPSSALAAAAPPYANVVVLTVAGAAGAGDKDGGAAVAQFSGRLLGIAATPPPPCAPGTFIAPERALGLWAVVDTDNHVVRTVHKDGSVRVLSGDGEPTRKLAEAEAMAAAMAARGVAFKMAARRTTQRREGLKLAAQEAWEALKNQRFKEDVLQAALAARVAHVRRLPPAQRPVVDVTVKGDGNVYPATLYQKIIAPTKDEHHRAMPSETTANKCTSRGCGKARRTKAGACFEPATVTKTEQFLSQPVNEAPDAGVPDPLPVARWRLDVEYQDGKREARIEEMFVRVRGSASKLIVAPPVQDPGEDCRFPVGAKVEAFHRSRSPLCEGCEVKWQARTALIEAVAAGEQYAESRDSVPRVLEAAAAAKAVRAGHLDGPTKASLTAEGPEAPRPRMHSPSGIVWLSDGAFLIADAANHCLRRVDVEGETTTVSGVPGQRGCRDSTTDFGDNDEISLVRQALWHHPSGMASLGPNAAGAYETVVVCDEGAHVLRVVRVGLGPVPKPTETETVCGAPGLAGHFDGVNVDARLHCPCGVCARPGTTTVFVCDAGTHVISEFDTATRALVTRAGAPKVAGCVEGSGAAARFNRPRDLCLVGDVLVVADEGNRAVRAICTAGWDVATLVGGAGAPKGNERADGPAAEAVIVRPTAVCPGGADHEVVLCDGHAVRAVSWAAPAR